MRKDAKRGLTKQDSSCVKGIAIILMLFHHLFNDYPEYDGYPVSYAPFSGDRLTQIALLAKVCVALFVFVTGYGLSKSYRASRDAGRLENPRDYLHFSAVRWWRLMSQYWLTFILAVLCQPLGRTLVEAYGGPLATTWPRMIIDVFGLSFAAQTPPLNPTTWYLTLATWFLFAVPLFNYSMDCLGTEIGTILWGGIAILLGRGDTYCHYMLVLLVGIAAARMDVVGCLDDWLKQSVMRGAVGLTAAVLAAGLMILQLQNRQAYGITEGAVALFCAIACHYVLSGKAVTRPLVFLGEHSTMMFLTHTLLYSYYFLGVFYERYYWWLITATLVVVSLIVALGIEWLGRVSGYDRLMESAGVRLFPTRSQGGRG